ncbi:MAG: acetyl-CoA carboxylase carboxyl transferase subunit alpha, partial [Flavobacteriia bacterium]|nr:acetyl-CoA carboxylase carboxyl transferase subunit alpha [Flavobacteriia bacterium]
TWYSVISPESCSSILWRSWDYKEQAASALKLTAQDMLKNNLIDGIIKEPLGGAHNDPAAIFETVKEEISKQYAKLKSIDTDKLIDKRVEKFSKMGVYSE